MNVYAETSAWLKLYVDKPGSELVWQTLNDVVPITCRITWAEALAAIARREREGAPDASTWATARKNMLSDWPRLQIVEVTQPLVERAGELAAAFSLRGYDAVQLAAGDIVRRTLAEPVTFASFDRRLNRAAQILGLQLPEGGADVTCGL